MKKILLIILMGLMCFSLGSCSTTKEWYEFLNRVNVGDTTFTRFGREILKEHALYITLQGNNQSWIMLDLEPVDQSKNTQISQISPKYQLIYNGSVKGTSQLWYYNYEECYLEFVSIENTMLKIKHYSVDIDKFYYEYSRVISKDQDIMNEAGGVLAYVYLDTKYKTKE